MATLDKNDTLQSTRFTGLLGPRSGYGEAMFGDSHYADSHILVEPKLFGDAVFGYAEYGEENDISGIWQERQTLNGSVNIKLPFYIPKNPHSDDQKTQRDKMAPAIAAWNALTADEKMDFIEMAFGTNMSGYNLFLSWFLSS